MTLRLGLLLVLLLMPAAAFAAERPPWYFGVTLGAFETDEDIDGFEDDLGDAGVVNVDDLESTDWGLRGGYRINQYFGLEGRIGFGTGGSSDFNDPGDSQIDDIRDDLYYGAAFARFDIPFNRVNLFALAGFGGVTLESTDNAQDAFGLADDYSETGVSWGFGVELFATDRTGISVDYLNYADDTHEGFSIGIVHHFDWPAIGR